MLVWILGMDRYQHQIFNTFDTGLRNDGIDMHKQYQCVSMHVCTTLRMRKVYVSTHWKEMVMSSGSDSGGDTGEAGSSSQIASIRHALRHINMFLFLNLLVSK